MGNIIQGLKDLTALLASKPWAIFIVLTLVYGYLYFEQNQTLQSNNLEIGGLRAEMKKMNEIIILKVQLAQKECQ